MWCQDETGPCQAIPQPDQSWWPEEQLVCQPHEYIRRGTAKLLILFRLAASEVRAKGVTNVPDVGLHPWLQKEVLQLRADVPDTPMPDAERPT